MKTFDVSGMDAYRIHKELSTIHGCYDRFDELMTAFNIQLAHADVSGTLRTLEDFRQDMQQRNLTQYYPIINALCEQSLHTALEHIGDTL